MPKHLVNLYQIAITNKEKHVKSNFVDDLDSIDLTNLDVFVFFVDVEANIGHENDQASK